jgi:hypothetical protein
MARHPGLFGMARRERRQIEVLPLAVDASKPLGIPIETVV